MRYLPMLNFPYYSLRQYDRIWDEGPYKLISTYYGTYVLDYVDKTRGKTLAERRLQLLTSTDLPYKVYQFEKRYTNVAQLLIDPHRIFLDKEGEVKKIRKPHRYRLTCCKVLSIVELGFKKYGISFMLDGVVEYFVHSEPSNFIQVLILKTGWLYYTSVAEKLPDTIRGM